MPHVLAATGKFLPLILWREVSADGLVVQDEDTKNLMMSWYYAGYYTGLYEGKQQGYALAKEEVGGG